MKQKCTALLLLLAALPVVFLVPTGSYAQGNTQSVCSTDFFRPAYPTRQKFCAVGEMVADAYDPMSSFPCEEMEVDHLVSLRYAHKNGVCDPSDLRKLANDPQNLRLTHWQTNRAKGVMSPEEFATRRLSKEQAERVLADASEIRQNYRLPQLVVSPELRANWLIAERDRLQRLNTQLLRDASHLRSTQVTYRGKKMQAAQAVGYHTSRISRIVTRSAFRNVGSMAAEALPFIGVGVIVGVTTWEILDACETLEANYELNIAFNPEEELPEDVKAVCSIPVPSIEEVMNKASKSPGEAWESAKIYLPSLPDISDVDVNWDHYIEATKSSAIWLAEETGASMRELAKAIKDYWGPEFLGNISLDRVLPWRD